MQTLRFGERKFLRVDPFTFDKNSDETKTLRYYKSTGEVHNVYPFGRAGANFLRINVLGVTSYDGKVIYLAEIEGYSLPSLGQERRRLITTDLSRTAQGHGNSPGTALKIKCYVNASDISTFGDADYTQPVVSDRTTRVREDGFSVSARDREAQRAALQIRLAEQRARNEQRAADAARQGVPAASVENRVEQARRNIAEMARRAVIANTPITTAVQQPSVAGTTEMPATMNDFANSVHIGITRAIEAASDQIARETDQEFIRQTITSLSSNDYFVGHEPIAPRVTHRDPEPEGAMDDAESLRNGAQVIMGLRPTATAESITMDIVVDRNGESEIE